MFTIIGALFLFSTSTSSFLSTPIVHAQEKHVKLPPIMLAIAQCESGNMQFYPNGNLVRDSVTGTHVGRFQIGLEHKITASKLGYDIYTTMGNTLYALYLYKTEGTNPWLASAGCWS